MSGVVKQALDPAQALLAEVRRIEMQALRLVRDQSAGAYGSVFRGQGMAFEEVRAYEPGDDVRALDWNVTARTGAPHVKLFTEERELTMMLVVDLSRSLWLGSGALDKRGLAARVAATMALSAVAHQDRVGLVGFTDRIERVLPPRAGRNHALAIVRAILADESQSPGTDIAGALQAVGASHKGHGVVVLISDMNGGFAESPSRLSQLERALAVTLRRHEVIPVWIEDALDQPLPPVGLLSVEDLEFAEVFTAVNLNSSNAKRYGEQLLQERQTVTQIFRKLGLSPLMLNCADDWQLKLRGYFSARARRR